MVLMYPGRSVGGGSIWRSEVETILSAFLLLSSFERVDPFALSPPEPDDFLDRPSLLFRLNKLVNAISPPPIPIPNPIFDESDDVDPFRLWLLLG